MGEVLFEITEDNLETGLRGYPVGYCVTSTVDPIKGLLYQGHPVSELAFWKPEQVIYLLHYGKEGSKDEIRNFSEELKTLSKCPPQLIEHIQSLPRVGHPMKLFCTALLLCGMFELKGDYRVDALNIVAKIPEIAATVINHHAGWGNLRPSNPDLGYMENFVQMLNVPKVDLNGLIPIIKLFNILHYDHGGGNLSAFVGKAVASGLEDMYGSLTAAMGALAGPRHGRANQDSLEFVESILNCLGENATSKQVEEFIRAKLANNELVYGFGHAVLRVEDPRATIFYELASSKFPRHPLVKIALLLRTEGKKVMAENSKIADPYPNIDAISGTVLSAAGFSYPQYFTVLFGMSRIVGISRQIIYERYEARGGKGTPIVRPKYFFKSQTK